MESMTMLLKVVAIVGVLGAGTIPLANDMEGRSGQSNAQPADKVTVAGSTIEHMTAGHATVTLFDATVKTSSPTDLLIEVNAECALWTEVTVVDDDDTNTPNVDVPHSESEARVKIWAVFDGQTVLVSSDDTRDPGRVVFCDRIHGMTLDENDGDEDNETISNYLRTRSANSFSWIRLNTGSGTHTLKVFAQLDAQVNMGEGSAEAAVGKRTLVVEPVKLANNASI